MTDTHSFVHLLLVLAAILLTTLLAPPLIQGVAKRDSRARELMPARTVK